MVHYHGNHFLNPIFLGLAKGLQQRETLYGISGFFLDFLGFPCSTLKPEILAGIKFSVLASGDNFTKISACKNLSQEQEHYINQARSIARVVHLQLSLKL